MMTDGLRRAIRKLVKRLERNAHTVIFGRKVDYCEGLNAAEINRLAGGTVISSVGSNSPGVQHEITIHHPEDSDDDEVWVIHDRDTRSLGNDSHHAHVGNGIGPKLRDTIAVLQAWADRGAAATALPVPAESIPVESWEDVIEQAREFLVGKPAQREMFDAIAAKPGIHRDTLTAMLRKTKGTLKNGRFDLRKSLELFRSGMTVTEKAGRHDIVIPGIIRQ